MSTAVVPPRPAAVPPRPAAPPVAGAAAIPPAVNTAPPVVAAAPAAVPAPAPVNPASAVTGQPIGGEVPGTGTEGKKRKGRKASTRTLYHGVVEYGADGNAIMDTVGEGDKAVQVVRRKKLESLPTDYDRVKFEKLTADDFTSEALYYEFLQAQAQESADRFGAIAKRLRTLGNISDQKSATKLIKMREQMDKLAKQLGPEAVAALLNGASA